MCTISLPSSLSVSRSGFFPLSPSLPPVLHASLVTFEAAEDASRAMELLCGREVEGRPLYVREDRTEIEKEEGFVVFVSRTYMHPGRRRRAGGEDIEDGEWIPTFIVRTAYPVPSYRLHFLSLICFPSPPADAVRWGICPGT
jgi:hypothetical protein